MLKIGDRVVIDLKSEVRNEVFQAFNGRVGIIKKIGRISYQVELLEPVWNDRLWNINICDLKIYNINKRIA